MLNIDLDKETKRAVVRFSSGHLQLKVVLVREDLEDFITAASNIKNEMDPSYVKPIKLNPKYELALITALSEKYKKEITILKDFCEAKNLVSDYEEFFRNHPLQDPRLGV